MNREEYLDFVKKQKEKRRENRELILQDEENRMCKNYTKEEIEYIIENIEIIGTTDIGYALGRTAVAIRQKATQLRKKGLIPECRKRNKK